MSGADELLPVAQAARRLLRHPRPGARRGQAPRGRGPPDHQAEHRQPGAVRLRGAGRDPRRRHPQPAAGAGLLATRRACCRRAPRSCSTTRSAGIDIDDVDDVWLGNGVSELITHEPAGDARQRRRGAGPGAGLPAVDGGDLAGRRPAGALPVRRVGRLAARPRRPPREDHRAHQGDRRDQPEQPDRRGVLAPTPSTQIAAARPRARPGGAGRRDLRQDPLRRRRARAVRRDRAGRLHADLQRPVQGLPGRRLPLRLDDGDRPEAARAQLPRRHHHPGQHAAVRERAGPARGPDRPRRPAEHQRPGPARRPAARAARRRGQGAARHSRASAA